MDLDTRQAEGSLAYVVFGGGCFWCTEAMFARVEGVQSVISGYAGGDQATANYKAVCTGGTEHAEVVKVTYDANVVSAERLLNLHMLSHDPTSLNKQGADQGRQYRSVIFYQDESIKSLAVQLIEAMQSHYPSAIVTTVEPLNQFYPAEDYHQDYFINNRSAGYCQVVIEPKVAKFTQQLKSLPE